MNKLRLLFLVFSLKVFALTMLQAQEGPITIRSIQNKTTVEFKGADGKIVKTLSIEDLNPYKNGFQPKSTSKTGKVARSLIESNVSNAGKSSIALSYSVKVYSDGNIQLQELGESTLVVYSTTGSEIFRQRIEADNAGTPLIAPNAKYVAVPFAGLVHDDKTRKIGFSIYNIETKSLIYDFPTGDIAYAWVVGDVFVFDAPESGFALSRTYYVFDTRSKVLYKKTYERSTLSFIKRFENDGVVFLLPPDAERTEKYETHFTKVNQ